MRFRSFIVAALALAWVSPAFAAAPQAADPPPAQIGKLLACREIGNAEQRLACFDRETGAVAEALQRRDLVAVDRDKMRATRRSLFGLPLPKLGIFDGDESDEVKEVEGVIASVGRNRDGGFTFRLADGARWSQTDDRPIALEPRAGDKVVVRRGMLGSYRLSVGGQPGVKVERTN